MIDSDVARFQERFYKDMACSLRPDVVAQVAGETGIVPCYEKNRDIVETSKVEYMSPSDAYVLEKYVGNAVTDVGRFYGGALGVAPCPKKDLVVGIAKLPTEYRLAFTETGKLVKVPVGKTYGVYIPEGPENPLGKPIILYDPMVFPEMDDSERDYWIRIGKEDDIPDPQPVVTHEYVHHSQDNVGYITNAENAFGKEKYKILVEGQASYITDQITTPTPFYEGPKKAYKKIEDDIGLEKALVGDFNGTSCDHYICSCTA